MLINVLITRQENAQYFNTQIGGVAQVDFEDYIAGVVASEIGNANIEACKAQAVAARSYAVAHGVLNGKPISDSSAEAQAFRASRATYVNPKEAVLQTRGEVLCFGGKVISAVYSASNGGYTVSSEEQWGGVRPYLIAQRDSWDTSEHKKGHGVGMSQTGIKNASALGINYKQMLTFYYPGCELRPNYGKEAAIIEKAKLIIIERNQLEKLHNDLMELEQKIMERLV